MLRLRLFYGLLTIILLLWSVGAAALLLMRNSGMRLDTRMRENYVPIDTAQGLRTLTATLNTRYLPSLAGELPALPLSKDLFDEIIPELESRIALIRKSGGEDERWRTAGDRLHLALTLYKEGYGRFFDGSAATSGDRAGLLGFISTQTQQLTTLSENVMNIAEERMFMQADHLENEVMKNILFVATLVLLGTLIAVLMYVQLVRHMVDPVMGLRHSIDEIKEGNFELTLPAPAKGSEFGSVVGAFNDMAAELKYRRRESDEHLMRANLVNRAILEAFPSPVYILSDDSGILQKNPAAEKLSEFLGVTGRLPLKIQRIVDECRENRTHFLPEDPREAVLFRIDEQEFYFLPRVFRFQSEDETQSGWAVQLHNVSRIRWLDDMKTNLLSTVSHEIKTPLTGIRMVLHLLMEQPAGKLDATQRTMISSASGDCERLLETLNTLLDLSRAESGATELSRGPLRLAENMERTVRLYHGAAAEKNIVLRVEIPPGEWPEVFADPVRLDEVLNNLVSNAIKHSPPDSPIVLRLSKPDAEHLRVTVTDRGPGVPEGSQTRIFERFFRAPGQTADGVGLGLFISREIMRAHEGRIGIRERVSNETEFYIDVPIA